MRRVPAILLLFLFSFSPIGPALFVDGESNLPACCRRDGKHHCGMMPPETTGMADAPSSGPAVDAPRARCPFFPNGGALLPHSEAALLTASRAGAISMVGQFATAAQVEAGYRTSVTRSHPKRGPPPTLFS
ncbi:MAG: hypothetical protein ABSC93_07155 [Bryobacteraceae bacterium]|jgi:hypothetical protein